MRQSPETPTTEALARESAATYLDMSASTFDESVRPFVPFVEIVKPGAKRPLVRWLKSDLDVFLATRRRAA